MILLKACADCGQPIEPGQPVHYGDKYYTHVTCPTAERSDKP